MEEGNRYGNSQDSQANYPMTVLPCDTLSKIWFMTLRVGTVLGQVMQIPAFSIFHFFNPNLACIFPVNVL